MANMLDDPTNRVIVSLLLRVRDAATLGMMALIERIEERAKKTRLEHPGSARWAVGNSGAGGPGGSVQQNPGRPVAHAAEAGGSPILSALRLVADGDPWADQMPAPQRTPFDPALATA